MIESSLGISAGAAIAQLFDYADLDGTSSSRTTLPRRPDGPGPDRLNDKPAPGVEGDLF
jgi:hypothetical protein